MAYPRGVSGVEVILDAVVGVVEFRKLLKGGNSVYKPEGKSLLGMIKPVLDRTHLFLLNAPPLMYRIDHSLLHTLEPLLRDPLLPLRLLQKLAPYSRRFLLRTQLLIPHA